MASRDVNLDLVGHDKTRGATSSAARNFDRLQRKINNTNRQVERKTKGMGKSIGALGVMSKAGPIGAAIAGLGAFALAGVKSAATAEQAIGGVQAVFGGYFRLVERNSERAADKYGLSAQSYQTSAALIGASLKNQGVATHKLSGLTERYIKRGADLAATYGGTAPEAVEAFTSALKGEFEMLERYGISIKQSTLNAEAMRLAKVKSTAQWNKLSEATRKAKTQQALWNLIQKQSTDAEGQANRERETTIARWERIKAKFVDLLTGVSGAFQPIVNLALEKVEQFIDFLDNNKGRAAQFFVDMTHAALTGLQSLIGAVTGFGVTAINSFVGIIESWNALPFTDAIDTGPLTAYSAALTSSAAGWVGTIDGWKASLEKVPKIVKLQGNIKDLETKIASAKVKLKDPKLTDPEKSKLRADIRDLQNKAIIARAELARIKGKTVEIVMNLRRNYYSKGNKNIPTNPKGDSAAGMSWQGAAGGSYRSGGPSAINVAAPEVSTRIFIDGREIRTVARSTVIDENRRAAHRARVGRR